MLARLHRDRGTGRASRGAFSAFTDEQIAAMVVKGSLAADNPGQPDRPFALFSDVLTRYGGRVVIFVEDQTYSNTGKVIAAMQTIPNYREKFVWKQAGPGNHQASQAGGAGIAVRHGDSCPPEPSQMISCPTAPITRAEGWVSDVVATPRALVLVGLMAQGRLRGTEEVERPAPRRSSGDHRGRGRRGRAQGRGSDRSPSAPCGWCPGLEGALGSGDHPDQLRRSCARHLLPLRTPKVGGLLTRMSHWPAGRPSVVGARR